jgi:Tol biopolymer transport system component
MTLGNHPTIVYMDEPPASGGPVLSSLIRYDVTTASKAEILNTAVREAQVSPDGGWIAVATLLSGQPALQLVGTDGLYVQTLFGGEASGSIGGILWSKDEKSVLFSSPGSSGPPSIYLLDRRVGTLQTALINISSAPTSSI